MDQEAPKWWKVGLIWGVIMFILAELVIPLLGGEDIITEEWIIKLPLWAVGGLIFGYAGKLLGDRMKKKEDEK